MAKRIVVLVHGWSVHNTDTYGGLAQRLEMETIKDPSLDIDVKQIWLGKYVSFRDEVRLDDISKAFEIALRTELGQTIFSGTKCIVITHSTGGPVIRNWIDIFYTSKNNLNACPISHLIMLAPANFGSALAQLGKSRISRLKSWFEGVEPGQGVLDWLELGSDDSWQLNRKWINDSEQFMKAGIVFPFVIAGQTIDRSVYDHVNPYTGEMGSDGVVRVASANINTTYIRLEQQEPEDDTIEILLDVKELKTAERTAFTLVKNKAHSGDRIGIMRSIKANDEPHETVNSILKCIKVNNSNDYKNVCDAFGIQVNDALTDPEEVIEADLKILLPDQYFITDPMSMLIVNVIDDEGRSIGECDIIFTGPNNDPDKLPNGFLADKQRNSLTKDTMTFFFNYAAMVGSPEMKYGDKVLREKKEGVNQLGLLIDPHNNSGFAHYKKARLNASEDVLNKILHPNQTTLLEIVMKRVVHEGTFRITQNRGAEEFKDTDPGKIISSGDSTNAPNHLV
jgi:hypothetical protein